MPVEIILVLCLLLIAAGYHVKKKPTSGYHLKEKPPWGTAPRQAPKGQKKSKDKEA